MFIMDTCMKPAISEPREKVGEFAPKIIQMTIDPSKIGDVVGQRGKTINALIEKTGVKIDINDEGQVSICGEDEAMMNEAKRLIEIIVTDFHQGQILEGDVVSIKIEGERGLVFDNVLVRAGVKHEREVHLDTDEGNAAGCGPDTVCTIIK